jgi:hypothetical protein
MNKLARKMIAVAIMLATAVSSLAAETAAVASSRQSFANRPAPAPTVLTKKVALNAGERANYQRLTDQSRATAQQEAAGASDATKTVLVLVGVVVVVVAVMALAAQNSGPMFEGGLGGF